MRPKLPEGTPRCLVDEECARPSQHSGPCIDAKGLALAAPAREPMVTAKCHTCAWTAQHKRGDDTAGDLEVAKLLRRLLLEHVREAHPDNWGQKR